MDFPDQLSVNIKQATVAALVATVIEDDSRTIGEILDSLEKDQDADFLVQTFKELTIRKLLDAALQLDGMKEAAQAAAAAVDEDEDTQAAQAPGDGDEDEREEDDEEIDDDDDFEDEEGDEDAQEEDEEDLADDDDLSDLEDDDEGDQEEDEEEEPPKRAPKKRTHTNGKDNGGKLPLHDPEVRKEYQTNILRFIRKDEDPQGSPAARIRESVGGTSTQLRENLNELIEANRLSFTGKARGTRYHLAD